MNNDNQKFIKSITIPALFILILWVVKFFEIAANFSLSFLGIYPRSIFGLIGIITSPFIHANFDHLISNSVPLLILAAGIFYFYKVSSVRVILFIYFTTGILVWLFARESYHIGASGLIYGFVSFLFFSGLIRRDKRAITLALLVTFLYGSLVWGVLPLRGDISYESHLFGSFAGIIAAIIFRKYDPPEKYDWEDEPDDDTPPEKLEISYKKNYPPDNT